MLMRAMTLSPGPGSTASDSDSKLEPRPHAESDSIHFNLPLDFLGDDTIAVIASALLFLHVASYRYQESSSQSLAKVLLASFGCCGSAC